MSKVWLSPAKVEESFLNSAMCKRTQEIGSIFTSDSQLGMKFSLGCRQPNLLDHILPALNPQPNLGVPIPIVSGKVDAFDRQLNYALV